MVFLAAVIFFAAMWGFSQIGTLELNQIVYHMNAPINGTDKTLVFNYLLTGLLPAVGVTVAYYIIFYVFLGQKHQFKNKNKFTKLIKKITPVPKIKTISLVLSIVLFAVSFSYTTLRLDFPEFIKDSTTESTFIQDNYVDPRETNITFPNQKRNLVCIFMESTEATYFSEENGGFFNSMPEVEQLALDNVNFSNTDKLGGAKQYTSTDWTIAGLVSQTSGIPLKSSIKRNQYGKKEKTFLPGDYTLGEILEAQGYRNSFLCGSDIAFASRDKYFTQHGNYSIYDLNCALRDGVVEEKNDFWGFEDHILFELAKEQLAATAADTSTPFNFTMLTVDTHYPYGWHCDVCPEIFEPEDDSEQAQKYANYKNAMACSSRHVNDFVEWIKEQPFYQNTTIVLCGDHLSMSKQISEETDGYQRTVANVFINAAATPINMKNRDFGTFDMFPTVLSSLGCKIEGERLGLGTNLFSDKPTIAETIGYEALNKEISKKSVFYNERFLYGNLAYGKQ